MICDRPDLTLQAVLADQLRRIRHALMFIIVAVATALYLMESRFVTGTVLTVDGGFILTGT